MEEDVTALGVDRHSGGAQRVEVVRGRVERGRVGRRGAGCAPRRRIAARGPPARRFVLWTHGTPRSRARPSGPPGRPVPSPPPSLRSSSRWETARCAQTAPRSFLGRTSISAAIALILPLALGPTRLNDSFWIDQVWLDQFARELGKGIAYPRWLPLSMFAPKRR